MERKYRSLIEKDSTLRLIFAFHACIEENPNWIVESESSRQNREIAKKVLHLEETADYYFSFQNRFYSFTVEKGEEQTIDCRIEEYETFYDLVDNHLAMCFSYHVPTNRITEMSEVKKITEPMNKTKQKVA